MKIYMFDMDGTICTEEKTFSRALAKPLEGAVKTINALYEAGNHIIIFSARGWIEYEVTKDWLDRYGVKYHQLILGKPFADIYVDDRAIRFTTWKKIKKKLNRFFGIEL